MKTKAKTKDFAKVLKSRMARDAELAAQVRDECLNVDIAEMIYRARTDAKMTQSELAKVIGSRQSVIARLEDADYEGHSLTMLKRIAVALGRELDVAFSTKSRPLTTRLRSGGRVKDYRPIVRFNAERIRHTFPAFLATDDLEHIGYRGLFDADVSFDADARLAFEAHAKPYVRSAILKELMDRKKAGQLPKRESKLPLRLTDQYKVTFENIWYITPHVVRKAIRDFDEAIRRDRSYVEAYYYRGLAKVNRGIFNEAIVDLNRVVRLDPDWRDAYFERGKAYGNLEQFDRAIKDFNQVIILDPENVEAYNTRGFAYSELGRQNLAIEDLNKAISLNAEYSPAYANRAFAYTRDDNDEAAQKDVDKAIELGISALPLVQQIERLKAIREGTPEEELEPLGPRRIPGR